MYKQIVSVCAVVITAVFSRSAHAEPISQVEAAELAAHRMERLVAINKIDEDFLKRFAGMTLEKLPNGGLSRPTFKITASQQVDQGKEAHRVEITLDERGKALSYSVKDGESTTRPTEWPEKDPVTLAEVALHHLEDNAQDPALQKFASGLVKLTLGRSTLHGVAVAKIEIGSVETTDRLIVYVAVDGVLHGTEVVK